MNPIKSGLWSIVNRPRMAELIQSFEEMDDVEALRTFPELAAARALFVDWIERYDALVDALIAWNEDPENKARPRQIPEIQDGHRILDTISKIAERILKGILSTQVSQAEFIRVTSAMSDVVRKHVEDEAALRRIATEWGMIPAPRRGVE